MTIRTRLVCAFLVVALLVPLLGGIAVSRVRSIEANVETLGDEAIPNVLLAKEADVTQRDQQRAVLGYIAGGAVRNRDRYVELVPRLDQQLAALADAARGESGDQARSRELLGQIAAERETFDPAARGLIETRALIERTGEDVRSKGEAVVLDLITLRNRFVPAPATGGQGGPAPVPITLRNQITELLFGMEGMMSIVGFEGSLATGYVVTLDPRLRQRFEDASTGFAGFLKVAKGAGGPEDQAILGRVETKFYREFEPSARALMAAADESARARGAFTEAGDAISSRLDEMIGVQSAKLTRARQDARGTAGGAGALLAAVTLAAFAAAGALGYWFAGTITRPVRHLSAVAQRLSTGDVEDLEIRVNTKDEVADLADSLRRMMISVRYLMRHQPAEGAGAGTSH